MSNTTKTINDFFDALQKISVKKQPVSALIIENAIYNNDDRESTIITFDGSCLEIDSRDSGFCLILDTDELLSIIAFALDNGLQLP